MNNILKIYNNDDFVGILEVYAVGRSETYYFEYEKEWLEKGFEIDPNLQLQTTQFVSKNLWGAFCDISPERWGRLIQKRKAGSELRIKKENEFVSATNDIPKLTHISELCISSQRIERGESLESDIKNLFAPSGSLGGARPKASVLKDNELYIVKFPSIKDEYRQISRSEKTMLDVASVAKINVCQSELFETAKGTALLVKRFDRNAGKGIPYKSAMTLLGVRDGDESNDKSYCDLASVLDSKNKKELFRRMVFNGLFGNTDDHLRNHGVLYDKKTKSWNLSPAFDITPTPIIYSKQNHALNFVGFQSLPSIQLFYEIKSKFDIDVSEFKEIIADMLMARDKFEEIAKRNKINSDNLKMLRNNYDHEDFTKAKEFLV
nr:type II toxin-antitoxin system HipA family toxin [uncultured Campylobacter sp.]